ncbi:hypothetical protein Cob_v009073 [Colletotrichum orbiculare MAFF 240422]|uniref:Uncharacterized protein n=1 Tax=Colletotrichum orbiculare (strain 104-T / ATCC 96160 / CBS 514.97 / LARS 414 / MAFF 240422) TaxID=1213857 RepID=A0A484FJQ1_COLOR|nr:hypothetical protein Cob_v009073 [Colletotrichum orbiculare MAFF 240422]
MTDDALCKPRQRSRICRISTNAILRALHPTALYITHRNEVINRLIHRPLHRKSYESPPGDVAARYRQHCQPVTALLFF